MFTADLTIILPVVDETDAKRLSQAAHEVCPYSTAKRNDLDVGIKA